MKSSLRSDVVITRKDSQSFLEKTGKDAVLVERDKLPEWRYDLESILAIRVQFGEKSGWTFTDSDYRTVLEEYVEQLLSGGRISRKGKFLVLHEELEAGCEDFFVFSIGAKEIDGRLIQGIS